MKQVIQLLVAICLNLSVLAASSGWMMSNHGIVDAKTHFPNRDTTLRIDRHGWMLENGQFPFR